MINNYHNYITNYMYVGWNNDDNKNDIFDSIFNFFSSYSLEKELYKFFYFFCVYFFL